MSARHRFCILLAALWWGSLSGLAGVVVPLLFANLPSPASAGAMAARLFAAQTWVGVACAMLLLLALNKAGSAGQSANSRAAVKFIVAGLLLALLVQFGAAPRIVSARVDGGNLKLWHGLGSIMLLGQWLCAGWSLWQLSSATTGEKPRATQQ